MPGYDLINRQSTFDDGPGVVPLDEAREQGLYDQLGGNQARQDELDYFGPDPACAPAETDWVADGGSAVRNARSGLATLDAMSSSRARFPNQVVSQPQTARPNAIDELLADFDRGGPAAPSARVSSDVEPIRGPNPLEPGPGRLTNAARGLQTVGGGLEIAEGVSDLMDADTDRERVTGMRRVASGTGNVVGGLAGPNRPLPGAIGNGIGLGASTIQVAEGIDGLAQDDLNEQLQGGDDLAQGAVGMGTGIAQLAGSTTAGPIGVGFGLGYAGGRAGNAAVRDLGMAGRTRNQRGVDPNAPVTHEDLSADEVAVMAGDNVEHMVGMVTGSDTAGDVAGAIATLSASGPAAGLAVVGGLAWLSDETVGLGGLGGYADEAVQEAGWLGQDEDGNNRSFTSLADDSQEYTEDFVHGALSSVLPEDVDREGYGAWRESTIEGATTLAGGASRMAGRLTGGIAAIPTGIAAGVANLFSDD